MGTQLHLRKWNRTANANEVRKQLVWGLRDFVDKYFNLEDEELFEVPRIAWSNSKLTKRKFSADWKRSCCTVRKKSTSNFNSIKDNEKGKRKKTMAWSSITIHISCKAEDLHEKENSIFNSYSIQWERNHLLRASKACWSYYIWAIISLNSRTKWRAWGKTIICEQRKSENVFTVIFNLGWDFSPTCGLFSRSGAFRLPLAQVDAVIFSKLVVRKSWRCANMVRLLFRDVTNDIRP